MYYLIVFLFIVNGDKTMLYTEKIEEMIKLVIASRYFTAEHPVNLMLVCPPESGKTEMLKQFSEIPKTLYTEDITYNNLINCTYQKIRAGDIKTIIIPDYVKIIEKSKSTARNITTAISQLCHDGINNISVGNITQNYDPPILCNVLTAITKDLYARHHQLWRSYGFDTRFITLSYQYTPQQIDCIFDFIAEQNHIERKMQKISFTPQEITITTAQIKQFQKIVRKVAIENGTYGFRLQASLQTILKTSALLDNRSAVDEKDILKIQNILKYANTKTNNYL